MKKPTLPAIFIGHGSPMNVINQNAYTEFLKQYGKELGRPTAIVVISAHWMTRGTYITASKNPEQIYDFWGFPQELYNIHYAAKGDPAIAEKIGQYSDIMPNKYRGIDHAAWAVLIHLFPKANIPVLEISLDMTLSFEEHFELGEQLKDLRDQGVLFIGSGNAIHNLGDISSNENDLPYKWALELDNWIKDKTERPDPAALLDILKQHPLAERGIPTADHYLPLLYIMAMRGDNEHIYTRHESIQNSSISMRSFEIK